ncbi:MAG: aggregation factor core protein MAFp3, isoform C [Pseudomonadota bacterium]
MRKTTPLAILALLAGTVPAMAEVNATFREGAPVDRFFIQNAGLCDLGPVTLTIDLSPSSAQLIFDVTAQGAGVEVYQPIQVKAAASVVYRVNAVTDGMQVVKVELSSFGAGERVEISGDLDDTLTESALGQIRVAGTEIAGARVILNAAGREVSAAFDTQAQAILANPPCLSS